MIKLRYILFLILLQSNIFAQNIVHLCEGETAQNFAVPLTNGSTYTWTITSNIATIISGNGTEHIQIDLNNTGMFWLHVQETDVNFCNGEDSILIEVHPLPNPSIYSVGDIEFCEGDFVTLVADSMYYSLVWNNGMNTQSIDVFDSGDYYIIVGDTNGCLNTSNSVGVQTHPNPQADFWIDGVCFEGVTSLIDSSIISSDLIVEWIWDFGDGNYSSGPIVSHLYNSMDLFDVKLKVTSDFGCTDSVTKQLEIFHIPDASFVFDPSTASTLDPFIQFTNTTVGSSSLLWDFDDSTFSVELNPLHDFENPGRYDVTLTVSDTNACIDSVSHAVLVYYDFIVYVPSSFTPNGDGINEIFLPKGFRMKKFQTYEFTVYNRWGEKVFFTNSIDGYWDGNKEASGVYSWKIVITDEMGALQERFGEVSLIR